MNDYYANRKYFVYRHVAPNGKMYIGITSKPDPRERWGYDGSRYESNKHFWNAIQKYGWNSFKHIIVAHNLSVNTACHLEEYLIKKYDSMDNGYNQTSGGVRPTEVTDEIRNIISTKVREHRASLPEGAWASKFVGHKLSEATKRKIRNKHIGRKISQDAIDKRRETFKKNLTPERRQMYGNFSRGRVVSEETRRKLSEANKGKVVSAATRKILSDKAKLRYANRHKYIWVHLADTETEIKLSELSRYTDMGYSVGRSNVKNIYLTKNGETIKVCKEDLDKYISEGWKRGFSETRYNNIKKSKIKFIYEYGGNYFYTGDEVAAYLRNNGYPKISQGTINNICNGIKVSEYLELSDSLCRRNIHEDN